MVGDRRPAMPLCAALLLTLCAILAPALSSAASPRPASPAKAEMATVSTTSPLLRPDAAPRPYDTDGKPLPAATTPPGATAGHLASAWPGLPGSGPGHPTLGRFTRDGRAPPPHALT